MSIQKEARSAVRACIKVLMHDGCTYLSQAVVSLGFSSGHRCDFLMFLCLQGGKRLYASVLPPKYIHRTTTFTLTPTRSYNHLTLVHHTERFFLVSLTLLRLQNGETSTSKYYDYFAFRNADSTLLHSSVDRYHFFCDSCTYKVCTRLLIVHALC